MRISDWSSDVCSSDLLQLGLRQVALQVVPALPASTHLEAENLAAPRRNQGVHLVGEFAGHRDGDLVDRLQQHRVAVRHALRHQIGRAHVELQSLMRISYAVFCLKKNKTKTY